MTRRGRWLIWLNGAATACGGSQSDSNAPHARVDFACVEAGHAQDASNFGPPSLEPGQVQGKRITPSGVVGPDENTVEAMRVYGVKETAPALKVCVDVSGSITAIDIIRSSCFPRFDAQLVKAAWSWRYTPFTVNGVAVPACTAVIMKFRVPTK